MKRSIRAALTLFLVTGGGTATHAQAALIGLPAYSKNTTGTNLSTVTGYSLGFEFQPTVNITVTALGYYDAGQNGLVDSHEVAIFLANGNLLPGAIVTVVPADSNGGLDNIASFAYHALPSPVTLLANTSYRIAANTMGANDPLNYAPLADHTNALFISTGNGVYVNDGTPNVEFPTSIDAVNFYSTPNFLFTVPEPASVGILAVGGVFVLRRRR